jgi:chemotaxis protein CheD
MSSLKHVVGVSDMKVSRSPGDIIVTHALGSCLGIVLYDPVAKVGGILHAMLPQASVNPAKAEANPYAFVDVGTPAYIQQALAAGAQKNRLVVRVAGGAAMSTGADMFAVGKRNFLMLRKVLWKQGLMIKNQDVGGTISRTLYLEIETGQSWIVSRGEKWSL